MDNQQLSMEAEFNIANFNAQADRMSREQAIDMLKYVYRSMVSREKVYQGMLKDAWFKDLPYVTDKRPAEGEL